MVREVLTSESARIGSTILHRIEPTWIWTESIRISPHPFKQSDQSESERMNCNRCEYVRVWINMVVIAVDNPNHCMVRKRGLANHNLGIHMSGSFHIHIRTMLTRSKGIHAHYHMHLKKGASYYFRRESLKAIHGQALPCCAMVDNEIKQCAMTQKRQTTIECQRTRITNQACTPRTQSQMCWSR